MTNLTSPSSRAAEGAGYARLLVPAVAALLVVLALNASWRAIQATLRALDAPGELVVALPAALEPAALIHAWVTIDPAAHRLAHRRCRLAACRAAG